MKTFRDIRLLPVVLIAITALAVLKITGLVLDGGYVLLDSAESRPRSWAQDNLGYPNRAASDSGDITGSVPSAPKNANPPGVSTERPPEAPGSTPQSVPAPAAERAVLERLQERRQEIDGRAREIEIREGLLKATEKRLENKVEELKGVEARITAASQQKEEAESARFKGLVTMYENMKPKDAAKIFDRLEMGILIEIASRIKPAKMSDVMAQMQAEAAERLTVELARRSGADKTSANMDLPKIEGRPAARTQ